MNLCNFLKLMLELNIMPITVNVRCNLYKEEKLLQLLQFLKLLQIRKVPQIRKVLHIWKRGTQAGISNLKTVNDACNADLSPCLPPSKLPGVRLNFYWCRGNVKDIWSVVVGDGGH